MNCYTGLLSNIFSTSTYKYDVPRPFKTMYRDILKVSVIYHNLEDVLEYMDYVDLNATLYKTESFDYNFTELCFFKGSIENIVCIIDDISFRSIDPESRSRTRKNYSIFKTVGEFYISCIISRCINEEVDLEYFKIIFSRLVDYGFINYRTITKIKNTIKGMILEDVYSDYMLDKINRDYYERKRIISTFFVRGVDSIVSEYLY